MDIILYYDLLLYHFIHDHDQRDFIYLQVDIDKVSDWVDGNQLTLYAAMSKVMIISHRRVPSTLEVCLSLLSPLLQQVENYKYLVNSSFNCSTHYHNICSSAS